MNFLNKVRLIVGTLAVLLFLGGVHSTKREKYDTAITSPPALVQTEEFRVVQPTTSKAFVALGVLLICTAVSLAGWVMYTFLPSKIRIIRNQTMAIWEKKS